MNMVVLLFGVFVVIVSLLALAVPVQLRNTIMGWKTRSRFYTAILFRAVVGVLFVLAALATPYPMAMYVIAGVMFIAAMTIALMGQARMDAMIERMLPKKSSVVRLYALVGMLFGAFLIYAGR